MDLERAAPGADDDRVICRAPLLLLLVLASSGCGGKVGPNTDPPQIVPWSAVGGVRIGLTADGVRRIYGTPVATKPLHLPIGTRYANRHVQQDSYRVRGGRIVVTYVDKVVKSIYTNSSRYRTGDGLGVGVTVLRGPCRMNGYGSCEYFWRSYQFDECGNAWLDVSQRLEVAIYMNKSLFANRRGRIAGFEFGDPNVVLYCF